MNGLIVHEPCNTTLCLRRGLNAVAVQVPVDREISVFTGQYGNNITKPAETTATQFVVIERLLLLPPIVAERSK